MQVLWWLVPPLVATVLAMMWVGWAGRVRDDVRDDDTDEALARMQKALARPAPLSKAKPVSRPLETTHGVAVRRSARPTSATDSSR